MGTRFLITNLVPNLVAVTRVVERVVSNRPLNPDHGHRQKDRPELEAFLLPSSSVSVFLGVNNDQGLVINRYHHPCSHSPHLPLGTGKEESSQR